VHFYRQTQFISSDTFHFTPVNTSTNLLIKLPCLRGESEGISSQAFIKTEWD